MTVLVNMYNKLWVIAKRKTKSLILLSLGILLLSTSPSCTQNEDKPILTVDISAENPTIENWTLQKNFSVQIQNNSEEAISFWMHTKDQVNYRNTSTMLNSILDEGMSDKEKAIQIWKLSYESSFHHPFPYNHYLPDNYHPNALLTFPYTLCGEKAGIITNLAKQAKLTTRVVSLNEHIVPEVYYNNAWHMFDADKGIYFLNEDKEVAGVEDLVNQMDLVNSDNIIKCNQDVIFKLKEYQKMLKDVEIKYLSSDSSFSLPIYPLKNMDIHLAPGDKLVYYFHQTSQLNQWVYPRYIFKGVGYFEREILLKDFREKTYQESIPYIIKRIEISGDHSEVLLQVKNRITEEIEQSSLGKLQANKILDKSFNGPSESDLYYSYQLIFNAEEVDIDQKITVRTYFNFNALTSPFSQEKPIVFEWFEGNQLRLSQYKH